jgi:YHS domain-containing protein
VTVQLPYFFEVVYQPRETHVYVYRPLQEPLPAQDVRGEVAMQPHYTREAFRFPLRFVPPSAEAPEENHLVAAADVSQVPDGEMTVTLTLDNLPLREEPQVTFRQTFALTRPPPRVTVAPLTEADWQGVDRQQVCPVTGARLGSMGTPLKLLLNDQAVYLCCEGCVAKVRENPLAYFRRPAAARRDQDRSPAPQVAVVPLIAADRAGIDRQQICPVTGGRLGSMGEPIKLTVNGHVLYVCCEGCIRKVQQNPAAYLFRAAPPRAGA